MAVGAMAVLPAAAGTGAGQPEPRLVRSAHEFEAMMMKELLQPMTASSSFESNDEDGDSSSGNALNEFASEALGKALSQQGGFGIADRIVRDLSRSGPAPITGR
jgi:Rod binding domain-containing protein